MKFERLTDPEQVTGHYRLWDIYYCQRHETDEEVSSSDLFAEAGIAIRIQEAQRRFTLLDMEKRIRDNIPQDERKALGLD